MEMEAPFDGLLAKTMVSVVPRLEHKMEKLKYKKLKVVQPRI